MARGLVFFIASLSVPVFVCGATGIESDEAEPDRTEPNDLKLGRATSFHNKCAEILKTFVDGKGMVDYTALRRKRLDLRALLREFDTLDPNEYRSWPQEDKIAFWINVYNLQKLRVVTDNYPIRPSSRILSIYWGPRSIRHIERKVTQHKFLVMDEEFTFAGLDRRFFRGEFGEPRVFFALSNACLSSPPLRNEPFLGEKLKEQFADQARIFLANPKKFRIDRAARKVQLSSIFKWFGKDFVKTYGTDARFAGYGEVERAVLNYVSGHLSERDAAYLAGSGYGIQYLPYDWTLNEQPVKE